MFLSLLVRYQTTDLQNIRLQKIKKCKNDTMITLSLTQNPDIIQTAKRKYPPVFYVGFVAETNDCENNAREKLISKDIDMIATNNDISSGAVFGSDENEVCVMMKNGSFMKVERSVKEKIAYRILEIVARSL